MQRRKIRGADLKANPTQYAGTINAEKCIVYLRGIGVEIEDATADSWLDIQATHRFLKSEKTTWRRVEYWTCRCGAMQGYADVGRGRWRDPDKSEEKRDRNRKPSLCETCGTGFCCMSLQFSVDRDGTVRDYRKGVDAVIPLRLDEHAGGL